MAERAEHDRRRRGADGGDAPRAPACTSGACAAAHEPPRATTRAATRGDRCAHFDAIRRTVPGSDGCAECLADGTAWTELRVCLTCGHVGCCEDSPGRHAERHFHATGHPMICSYERLETWGWCYVDGRYFDPMPVPLPQRPYVWQAWLARVFGKGRRGRAGPDADGRSDKACSADHEETP